jgi:quercetin dioxygenase-like cupin family protein
MEVGPVDAPVRLSRGDLVSFPGDVAHGYEALEADAAAVLVMDYP